MNRSISDASAGIMTAEALKALAAPFPLEAHEQREGARGTWYTYITEEPLIERLNSVDPAWEFRLLENRVIEQPGAPWIVLSYAELTILGVTRGNAGAGVANERSGEYVDGKFQRYDTPRPMPLDEVQVKGAPTDALKRCARLFGVGAYLLGSPRFKAKDEEEAQRMFAVWYNRTFAGGGGKPKPQPKAAPEGEPKWEPEGEPGEAPEGKPEGENGWLWEPGRLETFADWALAQWPKTESTAHSYRRLLKALGLQGNATNRQDALAFIRVNFMGSAKAAQAMIEAYRPGQKAEGSEEKGAWSEGRMTLEGMEGSFVVGRITAHKAEPGVMLTVYSLDENDKLDPLPALMQGLTVEMAKQAGIAIPGKLTAKPVSVYEWTEGAGEDSPVYIAYWKRDEPGAEPALTVLEPL